jgi:hypothetical protein
LLSVDVLGADEEIAQVVNVDVSLRLFDMRRLNSLNWSSCSSSSSSSSSFSSSSSSPPTFSFISLRSPFIIASFFLLDEDVLKPMLIDARCLRFVRFFTLNGALCASCTPTLLLWLTVELFKSNKLVHVKKDDGAEIE